jgi:hypothetical protein
MRLLLDPVLDGLETVTSMCIRAATARSWKFHPDSCERGSSRRNGPTIPRRICFTFCSRRRS